MRAYKQTEVATARRLLQDLARRLDDRYPSAAASVREGLEETLTVITLGLSERLRQSLATTNPIESLISRTRHVKRNVKRWRGGQMVLRWTAAAILEAVKGFRRLRGHGTCRSSSPPFVLVISNLDSRSQWSTSRRMSPEPPLNFNSPRDIAPSSSVVRVKKWLSKR